MMTETTGEQIEARVREAMERSADLRAHWRECGVEDMNEPTREEAEETRRERYRVEHVYAHQRDRDARLEDEEGLGRWARVRRIADELAKIQMAWAVRHHVLARPRGRRILANLARGAEGYDEDGRKWGMVGLFIEDQRADLERSLGLDPDAERGLEGAVEAARAEAEDARAYDPLQDQRFGRRILDYERALADRSFVLLKRLDRDFENAYFAGEVDLDDDVPQYLFWTTPSWETGDGGVDARYVFRDLPPA